MLICYIKNYNTSIYKFGFCIKIIHLKSKIRIFEFKKNIWIHSILHQYLYDVEGWDSLIRNKISK